MKIATWNVNGIRAREAQLCDWLERDQPDVVCLQELKADHTQIPERCKFADYHAYWHGLRAYSGVSIHIRKSLFDAEPKFSHPEFDMESRIVQVLFGNLVVASAYVPNGGKDYAAKLSFLSRLAAWAKQLHEEGREVVLCGDINVARTDIDVHPRERKAGLIGQRAEERELFEELLGGHFVDVARALDPDNAGLFTWWPPWRNMRQRNIGWRIDYILASRPIAARATSCVVLADVGTSDHAPVMMVTAQDAPPSLVGASPQSARVKANGSSNMTLQQFLGIELPIIQAPMAGVQGSALAVAVSNAGGLGSLPCAMLSLDAMRDELATIKAQTVKPFNVNFFCHAPPAPSAEREAVWRATLSPYYKEFGIDADTISAGPGRAPFSSEAADVLSGFKPAVVSFHFGLPSAELLARVKAWGSKILSSATTVEEARWLEAHGVDAIIAQGLEAGGHRGMFLSEDLTTQVGTFALLPQIVRQVRLPVIAAGGIADAKGVTAAMALGAAGVQIGTAYLLCPEANTSAVHRAALKSEAARHTALTNVFTGRPARGIMNYLMKELGPISAATPAFPLATSAIAPLRAKAESQGSGDFSPLWSGQNASGCKEIPAAQLTRELAANL